MIDAALLLGVLLMSGGTYLMYGLGPALLLAGGLLVGLVLLTVLVMVKLKQQGGRDVQSAVRG
ncbi:MAG: hypothetical protein KAX58_02975 [Aeromonadaceae bacterium]|uniref:Uncharacterized protein n=1 Tax=Aeromonas media TaxID=651 RepID=A0ABX6NXM9_AERME|nr:hypothetical protein [Aeromonas media]MBP8220395.1 hypothetical protein [Aeromonadaceae bacterium]QJT34469.1 hypothetical protein E4187_08985 [Aeromonas media]QJT40045.1 hypothetical protein E4188_17140 [Aeromonas media]